MTPPTVRLELAGVPNFELHRLAEMFSRWGSYEFAGVEDFCRLAEVLEGEMAMRKLFGAGQLAPVEVALPGLRHLVPSVAQGLEAILRGVVGTWDVPRPAMDAIMSEMAQALSAALVAPHRDSW